MFSLNRTISIHELNIILNNIGIVPITCEELFKGIEAKRGTEAEYQVVLNMLEIYNEQVCIICDNKAKSYKALIGLTI